MRPAGSGEVASGLAAAEPVANPFVSRLLTTAIKGFALTAVPEIEVTRDGVPGNRDFFVVDAKHRLLSITRTGAFVRHWARLDPDGMLAVGSGADVLLKAPVVAAEPVRAHFYLDKYVDGFFAHGPWSSLLSTLAEEPVRLVRAARPAGGSDLYPISMSSLSSVRAVTDPSAEGIGRFRMLMTLDGVPEFGEDVWCGQDVRVGNDVVLTVAAPVGRCLAVNRDPRTGLTGDNVLRRIHARRGVGQSDLGRSLNLGVYATVVRPGRIRVGDPISLL